MQLAAGLLLSEGNTGLPCYSQNARQWGVAENGTCCKVRKSAGTDPVVIGGTEPVVYVFACHALVHRLSLPDSQRQRQAGKGRTQAPCMAALAAPRAAGDGEDVQGSLRPADLHILLVDDDKVARLVVGNLLRKGDYRGVQDASRADC